MANTPTPQPNVAILPRDTVRNRINTSTATSAHSAGRSVFAARSDQNNSATAIMPAI